MKQILISLVLITLFSCSKEVINIEQPITLSESAQVLDNLNIAIGCSCSFGFMSNENTSFGFYDNSDTTNINQ